MALPSSEPLMTTQDGMSRKFSGWQCGFVETKDLAYRKHIETISICTIFGGLDGAVPRSEPLLTT